MNSTGVVATEPLDPYDPGASRPRDENGVVGRQSLDDGRYDCLTWAEYFQERGQSPPPHPKGVQARLGIFDPVQPPPPTLPVAPPLEGAGVLPQTDATAPFQRPRLRRPAKS
jgi:hypothetical protein